MAQLIDSMRLLVLGMGTVGLFLCFMVFLIQVMPIFLNHSPRHETKDILSTSNTVTAIISAAINHYRGGD